MAPSSTLPWEGGEHRGSRAHTQVVPKGPSLERLDWKPSEGTELCGDWRLGEGQAQEGAGGRGLQERMAGQGGDQRRGRDGSGRGWGWKAASLRAGWEQPGAAVPQRCTGLTTPCPAAWGGQPQ